MAKKPRTAKPEHLAAMNVARTLMQIWPETFADWKPYDLATYFEQGIRGALNRAAQRDAKKARK